jgi:hypothetical protein
VEVDLPPVPKHELAYGTYAFEYRTGQRRVGFLAQVDRRLLVRQDEPSDISCVGLRRSSYPSL